MDSSPGWSSDLGTGVAEIDAEHQLQVQLVEALQRAVGAGRPRAEVDALLRRLDDTSNVHFMGEELLMRLHAWERYEQHTEEHRRLLDQLRAMRAAFETGEGAALGAAVLHLQAWLTGHIHTHDRAFGEYMARGGLTSPPSGAARS